jgi:hypothetical protein
MLGKLPLTIANHVRETRAVVKNVELINKTPSYYTRGPFPLGDLVGMGLMVDMELNFLVARGCIWEHVQFSMLRRLRATHTKNLGIFPSRSGGGCPICQRYGSYSANVVSISI